MRPDSLTRLRLAPEQMSLFCGGHVLVANRYGLVESGVDGLYHQQTRFMSRLTLTVDGKPVKPVSASNTGHCTGSAFFLAPAPGGAAAGPPGQDPADKGGEVAEKGIVIQVNSFGGGGVHQDVFVTTHALQPATVVLGWTIEADFADLDEITAGSRKQTAPVLADWRPGSAGRGSLTLRYDHPRLDHATTVDISCNGTVSFAEGEVRAELVLQPQQPSLVSLDIWPTFLGTPMRPWHGLDGLVTEHHPAPDQREAWRRTCAVLETDHLPVQSAWDRATGDLGALQMLDGAGAERATPMAGIPKYTALFGRDTLVVGLHSLLLTPNTLEGSLKRLAPFTADRVEDAYDAEPGKILHQHQLSPLAVLGENPFLHYYGDYSGPGLFILGACAHFAHTADRDAFEAVRATVFATLDWMDRYGDRDGDGFYEFDTKAGKKGIKNQGWKDSGQAILQADGRFVEDPIAVAEIQGLYYAAKQALAGTLALLGEHARVDSLMAEAAALKTRFNQRFWMPEEAYFALALGPDKAPVRSIASDAGSCLTYGIIDEDKAGAVAARLMEPDLFSGWGIRTLSAKHPAFNPLSYHLGSVWPVSSANISFGFKRYGFTAALHTLAEAMFDATGLFDYDRLPEVFGGHQRDARHPHPGIYPEACSPQAWSASAVLHIVHALTGLTVLAPLDTLVLDPALPPWLPHLTLRNVQVGKRRIALELHRTPDGGTTHRITDGGEGLRVISPPPSPPGRDRMARLMAALA